MVEAMSIEVARLRRPKESWAAPARRLGVGQERLCDLRKGRRPLSRAALVEISKQRPGFMDRVIRTAERLEREGAAR
jgi:hypothetical protein